jgi:23S rRNA-intervening sequence protein
MEGPKVITAAYDFIKWAIPHAAKFPRNQRYTLGERIESKLVALLDLLIEAQYSKEKTTALKKANLGIEQLRYLFRLAYDLRLISIKDYAQSSEYLANIGSQLGGWIKQQNPK